MATAAANGSASSDSATHFAATGDAGAATPAAFAGGDAGADGLSLGGFDHLHFWVGNAYQAATFFQARFGFAYVGYSGLETGQRSVASHVISQGNIFFVFSSPLLPGDSEIGRFLLHHGDAVRDIAFTVDDCRRHYERAVGAGAVSVRAPAEASDEHGAVVLATVAAFGDVTHTFVERRGYRGVFLPGYRAPPAAAAKDPLAGLSEAVGVLKVDHVVGNQVRGTLDAQVEYYRRALGLHMAAEENIATPFSGLRTKIMMDASRTVKMPLIEPVEGARKSQNQEFVDYNGGAGVQHIAFLTDDIIHTVAQLRARGMTFQEVPDEYYADLRRRLHGAPVQPAEDLDRLQQLRILCDFDERGYLLQIFTTITQDRPTVFVEIIQRRNHDGFGEGNITALFRVVELKQKERGNLV